MAPIKRATLISTTRSDPAVISFSPAPVVSSVLSLSLRSSVPVLLLHLLYVTPSLIALSPLSPRIVRFHSLFRTRTRTRTCIRASSYASLRARVRISRANHAANLCRAQYARRCVNYRSSIRPHTRVVADARIRRARIVRELSSLCTKGCTGRINDLLTYA